MMAEIKIEVRLVCSWWVKPYLALTRFGASLGLPLNPHVIADDIMRGIRIEVVK